MSPHIETIDPRVTPSLPFLTYLADWEAALPTMSLKGIVEAAGSPEQVAVISVDLIKGFTATGPLSSPRVGALVPRVAALLTEAHGLGVRQFVLLQDAHPPNSPEFDDLPAHCVQGTIEAETDDGLAALPFASTFNVMKKRSLDGLVATELMGWLEARPHLRRLVVVGDCTDLCVYELVMHLQMRAHALHLPYEVVVPARCVNTYDLPVETATAIGARPHDGDLLHRVFLHQMAANGVMVVGALDEAVP